MQSNGGAVRQEKRRCFQRPTAPDPRAAALCGLASGPELRGDNVQRAALHQRVSGHPRRRVKGSALFGLAHLSGVVGRVRDRRTQLHAFAQRKGIFRRIAAHGLGHGYQINDLVRGP